MKKIIGGLIIIGSLLLPAISFASKSPTPDTVHCYVNPLYGTGGYQPYFICVITK